MDEEEKRLLRRTADITEQNNRMLKKIRRASMISTIISVIWIGIVVGLPVFLYYYFLTPYLQGLCGSYQSVKEEFGPIPGLDAMFRDCDTSSPN